MKVKELISYLQAQDQEKTVNIALSSDAIYQLRENLKYDDMGGIYPLIVAQEELGDEVYLWPDLSYNR